jgi:hypothetical protein
VEGEAGAARGAVEATSYRHRGARADSAAARDAD